MPQHDETQFLLATLTGRWAVDVIAVCSRLDYTNITEYCKQSGVSCIRSNREDAAKLLVNDGGIGIGCYLGYNHNCSQCKDRALEAKSRYAHLSTFVGVVTLCEPTELNLEAL